MYSRRDVARLKEQFWTSFGIYMAPVLSATGEKINWINYKTGVKDIAFRMEAGSEKATVSIELSHRDDAIRQLFFEQFLQLKPLFEASLGEVWKWDFDATDATARNISVIS